MKARPSPGSRMRRTKRSSPASYVAIRAVQLVRTLASREALIM